MNSSKFVFHCNNTVKSINFPDKFLSSLSGLHSSDRSLSFDANRPFFYHVWDHKLNAAILSGCLKEFEGKKSKSIKRLDVQSDGIQECFDANGKAVTCQNFL